MRFVTAAIVALVLIIGGATAAAAGPPHATVVSFAPDLLGGDDGLPGSPDLPPLRYGPIDTPVDVAGNALDAHEGQFIGYFGGAYYLYGTSYGCGTHVDLSDDTPFCGFAVYRSVDLVHWRLAEHFFTGRLRQICETYCAFPKVVFNAHRRRYQMYFSSDNGGNIGSKTPSSRWLAESTSPAGPWGDLREPALAYGDSDAYGLAGHYMFAMHHPPNSIYTEIWAEHLDADGTGTVGAPALVGSGLYANVSAFRHGRYWYLTLATNARYYGPAGLVYLRAEQPTGPWSGPMTLSADSCGGTGQSVSVLPDGTPVEMIDLYRSSPADASPTLPVRERHGDWNQAIAGRYWAPLRFTADGAIEPIECAATTEIPSIRSSTEVPHQPDCRVSAHGMLQQDWTAKTKTVRIAIFQRATVTDPSFPAKVHEPTEVNAPLTIELSTAHGLRRWSIPAREVSWAPKTITLPVSGHARLRLRTTATDGCYGVLVHAADVGRYAAIIDGRTKAAPGASMV